MKKCTIITIGDELLMGQVIDTNSSFIAKEMNQLGISINQRIAIGDSEKAILETLDQSLTQVDITIITGGLGPTKDDITKKTLCNYFSVATKRDQKTYNHVKDFFESRGREFTEINQSQADIPENAEALFNKNGTAPGIWIEHKGKILICMPGVPFEMEYLLVYQVIPKLSAFFKETPLYYSYIQTYGIGESFLAEKIKHIETSFPKSISLAYLPSPLRVNLRISGKEVEKELIDNLAQQIVQEIKPNVYSQENADIFKLINNHLTLRNQTISFAESCTGGFLANEYTNYSGASESFKGSMVVYSDNAKIEQLGISKDLIEKYTVYSHKCAESMLVGLLNHTKTDFGIATTGIIEPSTDYPKPFVFIAYGNRTEIKTYKLDLFYPRKKNKEAIAYSAMIKLYQDFLQ